VVKEYRWVLVLVVVVVLVVVDLGERDVEAVVEVGLARQVAQLLVSIYTLSGPSEILVRADTAVVSVASVMEVPLSHQSVVLNLPVPCLSS
jgi:hypothetical protein